MAKSIQALREKRTGLAKDMRNHYDKFDGDDAPKWDKTADEYHNNLKAQIAEVDRDIAILDEVLGVEAAKVSAVQKVADSQGLSIDQVEHNAEMEDRIYTQFLRGGIQSLTQDQQMYVAENAARVRNDLSTGVPAEGGYLVPDVATAQLIEAMKDFGGVRQVATIQSTESGAPIPYPTTDATSEEGEQLDENTEITDEDPVFGIVNIGAYMFSSKGIAVPFQLIMDSSINIQSHIVGRQATALGRITNRRYTTGTGSGQPRGVVTAAGVGKVGATGKTVTCDFDDIRAVVHSVDPAYRDRASLMFHDDTALMLGSLKDDNNRPIWLPGVAAGDPDTIYRRKYTINQQMAPMAANAKSILFGDFSKYIVRDVTRVLSFRLTDSAYTRKAQVGFMALVRTDGNLLDANAIKYFQNSAS